MAQLVVDIILDRLPQTAITAFKAAEGRVYSKFDIMSTDCKQSSSY